MTLAEIKGIIESVLAELFKDKKPNTDSGNRKEIHSVLNYIHENYMNDIGMENIAAEVFFSADYLNYLFKEQTGQSLMKYVTVYRLKKAEELLKSTNKKIVDIGKSVGYQNTSYFCMIFKNYFGISPALFREKESIFQP